MAEPKQTRRHKTDDQETDWEAVFETPGQGLIPLIESAKSLAALRECTSLVIRTLFLRMNDEETRATYDAALEEIIAVGEPGLESVKTKITELLRTIKEMRKEKQTLAQLQPDADRRIQDDESAIGNVGEAESDEEAEEDLMPDEERSGEEQAVEGQPAPTVKIDKDDPAREAFADVCWDVVGERLDVLQAGIPQQRAKDDKLPFVLSAAYAARFESVVRKYLAPPMADQCRGIVIRAASQPAENQRDFIRQNFEDKNGRRRLWKHWQRAWIDVTVEKEEPLMPEKKASGLLKMLTRKKKVDSPEDEENLTFEEWQVKVADIRADNKRARDVSVLLHEDTGDCLPPYKEESEVLKELFGRSAAGLKKQIDALRQIAQQGENIGKAFDRYQKGKNVELALLAVSYQNPDLFLGKKRILKDMLKGFSEAQKTGLPLIRNYLPDHI